jgi:hypothetical protein
MIYGIDGSVAYYQFPWQIGFSYLAAPAGLPQRIMTRLEPACVSKWR